MAALVRDEGATHGVCGGVRDEVAVTVSLRETRSAVDHLTADGGHGVAGLHVQTPVVDGTDFRHLEEREVIGFSKGDWFGISWQVVAMVFDEPPIFPGHLNAEGGLGIHGVEDLASFVMVETPLSPDVVCWFFPPCAVGEAVSFIVVGDVDVIIEVPDESGILVFYRAVGSVVLSFPEEGFFVGDAVSISVAIGVNGGGVCFGDGDAIIEGKNHAGEIEVINEDGDFVGIAIAIGVFEALDSAVLGGFGAGAAGVLHVGTHFGDVHDAVPVPDCGDGLFQIRFMGDEVDLVSGCGLKKCLRFQGSERPKGVSLNLGKKWRE